VLSSGIAPVFQEIELPPSSSNRCRLFPFTDDGGSGIVRNVGSLLHGASYRKTPKFVVVIFTLS